MRIGLDIDDTICDTFEFLLPFCCKYYGLDYEDVKKKNYSLEYFIENYGYYDFAKKYYEKIVPFIPLKKDVVKYLKKLKKRGHQIIFITARGTLGYNNPYQITYDYLVKNKVDFDTLIVEASQKGNVCLDEEIDIYFDDSFENCEDVFKAGIKTYMFKTPYNKKCKEYKQVGSLRQIYRTIKKEEKNARRQSNNKS